MAENELNQDFLRLFLQNQNRIFGFVLSLVPRRADAEDIMQETALVMLEKFAEFEKGSNFYAWAVQIAKFKVFKFWDKQRKHTLRFSDEAIAKILIHNDSVMKKLDDRVQALEECLKKLNDNDKHIIDLKYQKKLTVGQIAGELGRSKEGLYKTVARIHNVLERCVHFTLLAWKMS